MKLGVMLGYSGSRASAPTELVVAAEHMGYSSAWTAEAWGSDAVTPAAWILAKTKTIKAGTAIMQMSARTPAMTAMTAMTLDHLSGGRFIVGIGASGPQVVEGWYGQPYGKPILRTKEYVSILKKIFSRERPLVHKGEHYQIPNNGCGTTGQGKPLKSILHGSPTIPIYTGVATEKGVSTAAEIADGCILVWMDPKKISLWLSALNDGFHRSVDQNKSLANFDLATIIRVSMGDDIDACRMKIKNTLALYIGGMGSRQKNFYNEYAQKLGYAEEARLIQDLFLSGQKDKAAHAVPDKLVDETSLVGPKKHVAAQLENWQQVCSDQKIGSLIINTNSIDELEFISNILLY
ncbi:MAG: LLM class F420-dependent oxidoreductase [Pseudomonadota bacterium]|nr:LLM class F420-dependent oxidoreductase [Pseudomonadota bacterium]